METGIIYIEFYMFMLSLQNRLWMKCIKFQNNRMIIIEISAYYENIVLSLFILHSNLNMILKLYWHIMSCPYNMSNSHPACRPFDDKKTIVSSVFLVICILESQVSWLSLFSCTERSYSLHSIGIVGDCSIWWKNKCILYRNNSFSNITSSKEGMMFAKQYIIWISQYIIHIIICNIWFISD